MLTYNEKQVPAVLDVGNDDYWGHGRADCLDVAGSAFLEPGTL